MSDYNNWKDPSSSRYFNNNNMSWRALAGNVASRAKDYVATKEYKNTYDNLSSRVSESLSKSFATPEDNDGTAPPQSGIGHWARNRMHSRRDSAGRTQGSHGVEKVYIVPGWAVRRYHDNQEHNEGAAFDIDVFVSGYASSMRPPELATRSQKVFMQLAKRYAALPKLPLPNEVEKFTSNQYNQGLSRPRLLIKSTEDLLQGRALPPTPSETEERELAELEAQFQKAELDVQNDSQSISSGYSPPPSPTLEATPDIPLDKLRRLHDNLNTRLEPFWSSGLANRTMRLSVWASEPPKQSKKENLLIDFGDDGDNTAEGRPLATQDVLTSAQGSFQQTIHVPWSTICTHPKTLQIAYRDCHHSREFPLYVSSEMLPLSGSPTASSTSLSNTNLMSSVKDSTTVKLTSALLRVISDLDDTVKISEVVGGAKKVFHNVFVNELKSLVIHDMSEWYQRMFKRGVRFHYVSNGPVALLPVVNEFIQISSLPEGSVKLRSYTGQSLFNGLLASPAARKRANVVEILNSFTNSRFILIGDSGEQDLELYAALARERPEQVQAVFIRDVTTTSEEPLTDPTGARWQEGVQDDVMYLFANPNATDPSAAPYRRYTPRKQSSLSSYAPPSPSTPTRVPGNLPQSPSETNANLQSLPAPTRKRIELQMRVNRARDEIPGNIRLRVFRDALECTEVEEILHQMKL